MLLTLSVTTSVATLELSDYSTRFVPIQPGNYQVSPVTRLGKDYLEFPNGGRLSVEYFTTLYLEGLAGLEG